MQTKVKMVAEKHTKEQIQRVVLIPRPTYIKGKVFTAMNNIRLAKLTVTPLKNDLKSDKRKGIHSTIKIQLASRFYILKVIFSPEAKNSPMYKNGIEPRPTTSANMKIAMHRNGNQPRLFMEKISSVGSFDSIKKPKIIVEMPISIEERTRTTFLGRNFTTGMNIRVPTNLIDPMIIEDRYSSIL
jgi:hypothetical protein